MFACENISARKFAAKKRNQPPYGPFRYGKYQVSCTASAMSTSLMILLYSRVGHRRHGGCHNSSFLPPPPPPSPVLLLLREKRTGGRRRQMSGIHPVSHRVGRHSLLLIGLVFLARVRLVCRRQKPPISQTLLVGSRMHTQTIREYVGS